jgi:hypothetical protein
VEVSDLVVVVVVGIVRVTADVTTRVVVEKTEAVTVFV